VEVFSDAVPGCGSGLVTWQKT